MSWSAYFEKLKGSPIRPLLRRSLEVFPTEYPRTALELGSGPGIDSAHLLMQGFKLTAVEREPEGIEHLKSQLSPEQQSNLNIIQSDFESLETLPVANLVYASLSLPFCKPESFTKFWKVIEGSFAAQCVFAASFFGPEDTWVQDGKCTGHSEQQLRQMLTSFPHLELTERKEHGSTALGEEKHWHIYFVVVKR